MDFGFAYWDASPQGKSTRQNYSVSRGSSRFLCGRLSMPRCCLIANRLQTRLTVRAPRLRQAPDGGLRFPALVALSHELLESRSRQRGMVVRVRKKTTVLPRADCADEAGVCQRTRVQDGRRKPDRSRTLKTRGKDGLIHLETSFGPSDGVAGRIARDVLPGMLRGSDSAVQRTLEQRTR